MLRRYPGELPLWCRQAAHFSRACRCLTQLSCSLKLAQAVFLLALVFPLVFLSTASMHRPSFLRCLLFGVWNVPLWTRVLSLGHRQQVRDDIRLFRVDKPPSCLSFLGVGRMMLLPFFLCSECYRRFANNSLHLLARSQVHRIDVDLIE